MDYILASSSPRRKELLKQIVDEYSCVTADIDEVCPEDILLQKRPEYLAKLKAKHIAEKNKNSIVIGADTAVFSGDKMLGKPKSESEAFNMLCSLSGKTHTVITGCAIVFGDRIHSFSVKTLVTFYPLSKSEILEYIATKEPFDKAGGYGIQGKGSQLIKGIDGDYFNVVGLPVSRLKSELANFVLLET
ncbi:MAG: Maf family protein [Clostridia bacterium]|nr:Maf family protein [Clostridia bacterium]